MNTLERWIYIYPYASIFCKKSDIVGIPLISIDFTNGNEAFNSSSTKVSSGAIKKNQLDHIRDAAIQQAALFKLFWTVI